MCRGSQWRTRGRAESQEVSSRHRHHGHRVAQPQWNRSYTANQISTTGDRSRRAVHACDAQLRSSSVTGRCFRLSAQGLHSGRACGCKTSVTKGGMYLSPAITTAAALKNEAAGISAKNFAGGRPLTRRELQVLQLIADGKSTKEIATTLEVSVKTIETHRKQIMDKLEIRTTAGLTKYCIREGLTSL